MSRCARYCAGRWGWCGEQVKLMDHDVWWKFQKSQQVLYHSVICAEPLKGGQGVMWWPELALFLLGPGCVVQTPLMLLGYLPKNLRTLTQGVERT